jgi:hypothetical protein
MSAAPFVETCRGTAEHAKMNMKDWPVEVTHLALELKPCSIRITWRATLDGGSPDFLLAILCERESMLGIMLYMFCSLIQAEVIGSRRLQPLGHASACIFSVDVSEYALPVLQEQIRAEGRNPAAGHEIERDANAKYSSDSTAESERPAAN